MKYLTFGAKEKGSYKICLLVNEIRKDEILKAYITPYSLNADDIVVLTLHQNPTKKRTPVAEQKAYITEELAPVLNDLGVEVLLIADGDYFKTFTKSSKIDSVIGYMLPTEFGDWHCTYVPNFRAIFYDPVKVVQRIDVGITALKRWLAGTYQNPGVNIIQSCEYPTSVEEIGAWLDALIEMDCPLAIDIEAFSLKHYDAGIGTISFAWSKTEGIAFPVDIIDDPERSRFVRELLRDFFLDFKNKAIYHNIAYDVYVLIYQLFMKDILDNQGLLHGLNVMLRNWDDTKLITYLATNSCAGNRLGLKDQAQEYAGNYAQEEIRNIRKIPLPQLLQYNLVDSLATWFVHEKHWDRMVSDNQLDIYETIFKPAIVDIIQMQLTGMPMNMESVKHAKLILQGIGNSAKSQIDLSPLVQNFRTVLANEWAIKRNQELKKKRVTPLDYPEEFNPNSGPQLIKLLYEEIHLPVLDLTETKLPATGGDTLKKLINHTADPEVVKLLEALIEYHAVEKILTSFIPAFEKAQRGPDGWHYLFGQFNLGGTVSGRLSSSRPNLQNLPAKSRYGKLIKHCFVAPPGWFFAGLDFASLEDKISALTTKDPNKLAVYLRGFDGHSMRAAAYFGDQMPDIDPDSVESVNTIADKYPVLRQDSKAPTFALTYAGTYKTLMANCGFDEEKALSVAAKYHELYKVSDEWVSHRLDQACLQGYVTAAFGLRVRTPMLHQVVRRTSKTPFQAEAEGRTAGNALGQSWCLLNSRAGSDFMNQVRKSPYRHSIRPCAQIHDAQYFLIKDDIDVIEFANTHLVKACQWQGHPDIAHDEVKLGGELSLFYPSWADEVTLPNGSTQAEIFATFEKHLASIG